MNKLQLLLGNKRNNKKDVSDDKELSSFSSSIDDSELEEENNQYKELFNGKIKHDIKEENKKEMIYKVKEKKLNNNNKKDILSLLPQPKNKLTDKNGSISLGSIQSTKLKSLINPDYLDEKKQKEDSMPSLPIQNTNSIEVINQNDIIDKDWERKYIDKLNKKNALNIHEEERTIKGNEHNIKNIIKNYNDEQNEALSNLEIKSKYSKISTKAKYGW